MSSVDVAGRRYWLATCEERQDQRVTGMIISPETGSRLLSMIDPGSPIALGCLWCGEQHDAREVDAETYRQALAKAPAGYPGSHPCADPECVCRWWQRGVGPGRQQ